MSGVADGDVNKFDPLTQTFHVEGLNIQPFAGYAYMFTFQRPTFSTPETALGESAAPPGWASESICEVRLPLGHNVGAPPVLPFGSPRLFCRRAAAPSCDFMKRRLVTSISCAGLKDDEYMHVGCARNRNHQLALSLVDHLLTHTKNSFDLFEPNSENFDVENATCSKYASNSQFHAPREDLTTYVRMGTPSALPTPNQSLLRPTLMPYSRHMRPRSLCRLNGTATKCTGNTCQRSYIVVCGEVDNAPETSGGGRTEIGDVLVEEVWWAQLARK